VHFSRLADPNERTAAFSTWDPKKHGVISKMISNFHGEICHTKNHGVISYDVYPKMISMDQGG
jgi:hypothetical protein